MKEFLLILPEIFLAATLAGLVFSEVGYHGERLRLVTLTALLGLGGAFVQAALSYQFSSQTIFNGTVSFDAYSLFFKLFFIVLAALAILSSGASREIQFERRAEYSALIIATTLAMCLAASANDLLLSFICVQFANLLIHFLSAFGRRSLVSTEAAVKHLLFSAISGAFLLFAASLLFAATRTLNLAEMHKALVEHPLPANTALVVFLMVFSSLAFQLAAFPMYLWAPDVLEGAPTPVSAFISIASRAVGFAWALRLLMTLFAKPAAGGKWVVLGALQWPAIVAILAGFTMLAGSLMALRQSGAKRLVANLVVAQSGFLLIGLLVLDRVGAAALLYNLVVELFALLGAFYVISLFQDEVRSDRLTEWRGMLRKAVPETVSLILFLGTLVGVPPFAGFLGKFTLVGAAIEHQWYALAVVAMVSWALGSIAITRLAFSLVGEFREIEGSPMRRPPGRWVDLAVLLIPMVLIGLFADGVFAWAIQALRPLLP